MSVPVMSLDQSGSRGARRTSGWRGSRHRCSAASATWNHRSSA